MESKMAAILEDLEIDASDMLKNPMAFARRIEDKARELREILRGGLTIGSHTENVKESSEKVPDEIQKKLDELYSMIDELPTEQAYSCIEAIARFKSDVEYLVKDKIERDVVRESASVMDKKLAHMYYVNLRKLYDNFVSTIAILDKKLSTQLPKIPVVTGNFGSIDSMKRNLYIFDDQPGEEYWSPHSVIRKLGMQDTLKTMMDLNEYIDNNPNCGISVHERML